MRRAGGAFWLVATFMIVATPPQGARGASLYDPTLAWGTITTPRFRVHYPDGARNLAVRVGREAEAVIDEVAELFGYAPDSVVEIVLSDASDLANGSAQVMPKNTIRMYLTAPTELTGLSSYDDWIRILLIHELAHICDIDQSWGITRVLRWIFGKYIQMNGFVPQFLSEGVGVYAETMLTPTGRGRSSYVEMILRTAAREDRFIDIDQAHIQYSDWPGPSVAYFYGGRFHLWLERRFGRAAVRDLHQFNAAMPLPYIYYPGAVSTFGDSLPTLWNEWRDEVRAEADELYGYLAAEGLTQSRRITRHGRNITGSRYSPDGRWIIYSRTSPVDGSTVRRVQRDGTGDRDLVLQTFSPRFSFSPDGKSFYYSQNAINERFNNYNDLYRFDVDSEETTKLVDVDAPETSLRGRDPDVSPDGARIVFVRNRLHQSWLEVGTFDLEDPGALELRVLVAPQGDMQHASPRFSPDGTRVAVSTWFPGGYRDIVIISANDGAVLRRVTFDEHLDGNPSWSPDGRYLLYESDADGVSNIYAFDVQSERYYRVTRVFGGAFQAEVSPDGARMLFRNASGVGFDIHEMPFAPNGFQPLRYEANVGYVPTDEVVATRWEGWMTLPWGPTKRRDDEAAIALSVREEQKEYSPWGTVLPFQDNWVLLPAFFFENEDLNLRLTTLGQDALAEHTWTVSAGSSLETQHLNWSVGYANDQWYPTFVGTYLDEALYFPRTVENLDTGEVFSIPVVERKRSGTAAVILPLKLRHLLGVKYTHELRQPQTALSRAALGYGDAERFAWLEFGYTYRYTRRYPYSVGDEDGLFASLAGRYYSRALGADFDELMLTLDARGYFNHPSLDNHVLAARVVGALAFGPDYRERFALGGAQGASLFSVEAEQTYSLRGFPLDIGQYPRGTGVLAGYLEYRFPLLHVERGLWTLPFYVERLHCALFVEGGETFGVERGGRFEEPGGPGDALRKAYKRLRGARLGTGWELRASLSLGWAFPLTVRAGVGMPVLERGVRRAGDPVVFLAFGTAI